MACGGGKPIEAAPAAPPAAAVIWHDPSQHAVTFVTVAQGVRIEVLDWGGTGEPLIFLNGLENTGHIFDNFAPRFTDKFHVMAMTRRGWGASGHPPSGYSIPVLVEDVHAVLDTLHIARADFVGHSIAGQELTWLAAEYPARVDRLVYLDAGFDYHTHPFPVKFPEPPAPSASDSASVGAALAYAQRMNYAAITEGDFRATERFTPAGRHLGPSTPPAYADSVITSAHAAAPPSVRVPAPCSRSSTTRRPCSSSCRGSPRTTHPAPCGSIRLRGWWRMQREAFARAVPQATVISLPSAGHYVFLGRADSVASAMRTFLLAPQPK